MSISMPAAVLAGGSSRRMGREKGALPYGAGTLAEFQTSRLQPLFSEVWLVAKRPPGYPFGTARVLLDASPDFAAIHGLRRALEEAMDRVFVLAVDLPALPAEVIRAIGERGLATAAPALLPSADGLPQPLAAVWRRAILPLLGERLARGDLSLRGLAEEAAAEAFPEAEWRRLDPSGNSFVNLNTLGQYAAMRERA